MPSSVPCHDRDELLKGRIAVIPGVVDNRVTIDIVDGIADVRMNRADKRNALDNAMFASLAAAGEFLKTNTEYCCGTAFDLKP